jgi:guanylate kinase
MSTMQGRLLVISGPSGVGKGTLLKRLFERLPGLVHSISATTRAPRPGEENGKHYYFMTREEFEDDIKHGFFLEYALYGENYYGTPKEPVQRLRKEGLDVVLEIEVQGAMQVRGRLPDATLIYIQPPSTKELERRLRHRGTETEERIQTRLAIAEQEQEYIPRYDYLITNDQLDEATDVLTSIVIAERHRVNR